MTRSRTISVLLLSLAALGQPAASASTEPPANDDFQDATLFETTPYRAEVDNAAATDEDFERELDGDCLENPGVWFRFEPASALETITVLRAPGAASLFEATTRWENGRAYQDPTSLRFIACHRALDGRAGSSDGNLQTFEAGHTYYFRVATSGSTGEQFEFLLDVEHGITGTIRDPESNPVGGATVWARQGSSQDKIAAACSRPDGTFRVSGLPRDTYKLEVSADDCDPGEQVGPDATPEGYSEYYEDKANFEEATPVRVAGERDTEGIEVVLGPHPTPAPTTDEEEGSPTLEPTRSSSPIPSVSPSVTPSIDAEARASRKNAPSSRGWVLPVLALLVGVGVSAATILRRRARQN